MNFLRSPIRVTIALIWSSSLLFSQEQQKNSPSIDDQLRSILQLIEHQSLQLEALTQQVSKLNTLLEGTRNPASQSSPSHETQNMPPVQEKNPAPTPVMIPPKAEIAGAEAAHVVNKGETLTSIAKQYKVSVDELQKVNKIENDRALQIGQTLIIPSTRNPDITPEKKENP